MGKKHKNSKHSKCDPEEDAVISTLLTRTSTLPELNSKKCWNEHLEIRQLLEKLEKMQIKNDAKVPNRSDLLPKFSEWLKVNGGDFEKVAVFATPENDCGVKALVDMKEGEKILSIPRNLILTSEYSSSTFLGSIIEKDKMLRIMPNVVLALKLLHERHTKDSFWKPYIDVLPQTFNTPLFFSLDDIRLLQGSPVLDSVLKLYKSISRQYAYLYRLFKKIPDVHNMEFMKSFSFSEYRWAVSIVMTRQNQIPCTSGKEAHLALIPLLDMCNHKEGQITTDYDLDKDACICFALHSCEPDDQVFIFYGPRSNSDFFLHSGFYYEGNKLDLLPLKLGISKSDSLYAIKTQLLSRLNLDLKKIAINTGEFPLTNELLAFLRIFCIDKDEGDRLAGEPEETLAQLLFDKSSYVSKENEEKIWSFLEMRCSLILRQYLHSKEEDDEALNSQELSKNTELTTRLCRGEKILLLNVIAFCNMKTEHLTEKQLLEK